MIKLEYFREQRRSREGAEKEQRRSREEQRGAEKEQRRSREVTEQGGR